MELNNSPLALRRLGSTQFGKMLLSHCQSKEKEVKIMASWQQETLPLASWCLVFFICKVGSFSPTTSQGCQGWR